MGQLVVTSLKKVLNTDSFPNTLKESKGMAKM